MSAQWYVVIASGRWFGRVGRADISRVTRETKRGMKVEVQFGTDGPFVHMVRGNLMAVATVVRLVEMQTGSRYSPEDDE